MLAHLGGVVAPAVWDLSIPLFEAGDLVPVEFGAEARTGRHPHGAVHKAHAAAGEDFVRGVLPGVVGVAGEGHGGGGTTGVGHDEEAQAEVVVGVHGEAEAEPMAEVAEALHGADPAPVVGIGEDDLDGAEAPCGDHIFKAGDGDVGGKGGLHAGREEAAAHLGHGVKSRDRVFEIAPAAQLLAQGEAHPDGGLHAPGAVGIDAEREGGAEFGTEPADGFDLDVRLEHAALELDCLEAIECDHLAALADEGDGREALAVLVGTRIGALAAASGVLEEEVGGEGGGVTGTASEQITDGLSGSLAKDVEAGGFDGGEGAAFGVGGIFAGDEPCLRAVAGSGRSGPAGPQRVELKRIHAEGVAADGVKGGEGPFTAVGLGDAEDPVCGIEADDGAQCVGGVKAVGASEGRIGNGQGMDGEFLDDHEGNISRVGVREGGPRARRAAGWAAPEEAVHPLMRPQRAGRGNQVREKERRARLLAHAGVGALQAQLAELAGIPLGLVDDKSAVAQIFGLIELVLLLLCQVDLQNVQSSRRRGAGALW